MTDQMESPAGVTASTDSAERRIVQSGPDLGNDLSANSRRHLERAARDERRAAIEVERTHSGCDVYELLGRYRSRQVKDDVELRRWDRTATETAVLKKRCEQDLASDGIRVRLDVAVSDEAAMTVSVVDIDRRLDYRDACRQEERRRNLRRQLATATPTSGVWALIGPLWRSNFSGPRARAIFAKNSSRCAVV